MYKDINIIYLLYKEIYKYVPFLKTQELKRPSLKEILEKILNNKKTNLEGEGIKSNDDERN